MIRKFPKLIALTTALALLTAPGTVAAGDFWDFLRNAWENIQNQYYQNNQNSADSLENEIMASAAESGVLVSDAEQYDEYAGRLAKTLSMLTPEQQARVFGK